MPSLVRMASRTEESMPPETRTTNRYVPFPPDLTKSKLQRAVLSSVSPKRVFKHSRRNGDGYGQIEQKALGQSITSRRDLVLGKRRIEETLPGKNSANVDVDHRKRKTQIADPVRCDLESYTLHSIHQQIADLYRIQQKYLTVELDDFGENACSANDSGCFGFRISVAGICKRTSESRSIYSGLPFDLGVGR